MSDVIIVLASTLTVGILLVIIGCINLNGNISAIHSYHRQRVAEENKKPFGKMVGIGNIIIGISSVAFGVLYCIGIYSDIFVLTTLGTVVLLAGIIKSGKKLPLFVIFVVLHTVVYFVRHFS